MNIALFLQSDRTSFFPNKNDCLPTVCRKSNTGSSVEANAPSPAKPKNPPQLRLIPIHLSFYRLSCSREKGVQYLFPIKILGSIWLFPLESLFIVKCDKNVKQPQKIMPI